MRVKAACCTALLLLLASPALAETVDINVMVVPAYQEVDIALGYTTADIVADIPLDTPVAGWGIDLELTGTSVSVDSVAIGADWVGAPAPDGDGLAGLAFPDPVAGQGIVLATVTFSLDDLGMTNLTLSDDYPVDLSEGFALFPAGYADNVIYCGGCIDVVPEPATIGLLIVGAFLLRRR